jgi:hypothetical protein
MRLVQDGVEYQRGGVPAEGHAARGHLVERGAEGKQIAAPVECLAARLLGQHVGDGPDGAAWTDEVRLDRRSLAYRGFGLPVQFGQAEVDLGGAALGVKMLTGLMSRRTIPSLCAASSASAIWTAFSSSCSSGSALDSKRCFRVWPLSISITMNCSPPSSAISWMVRILGWFSAEAARASRRKTFKGLGIVRQRPPQKFERNAASEVRVLGLVHYSHTAAVQLFQNAEVADGLADHYLAVSPERAMVG